MHPMPIHMSAERNECRMLLVGGVGRRRSGVGRRTRSGVEEEEVWGKGEQRSGGVVMGVGMEWVEQTPLHLPVLPS